MIFIFLFILLDIDFESKFSTLGKNLVKSSLAWPSIYSNMFPNESL